MFSGGFAGIRSMSRTARTSVIAVGAGALVMTWLLYRTESNATQIGRETQRIASSGRGINNYTDSLALLNTTNKLAASILTSAQRVDANLSGIASAAGSIDTTVSSIQLSTASIAGSTHSIDVSQRAISASVSDISANITHINSSLSGVNGNASDILATSLSIQRGVALIGSNLATTRSVASQILAEATDINQGIAKTDHEAACIDNGLNGGPRC